LFGNPERKRLEEDINLILKERDGMGRTGLILIYMVTSTVVACGFYIMVQGC
jgi:hypothetical protein